MPDEQLVRTHTINAPAADIFAVLADPARHHDTEPGDWVQGAIDAEPLTEVGQLFGMNMHLAARDSDYQMWNEVTVLEPNRSIAWAPGMRDDSGTITAGGHVWRYDLEPGADGATRVTLTYDWSGMPQQIRDQIGGMPPFEGEFLDESLTSLEQALA